MVEQSTGLFYSSSEMFLTAIASLFGLLGVVIVAGLSCHLFIYIPRRNKGKGNSFVNVGLVSRGC